MMKPVLPLVALLALSACAAAPPAPETPDLPSAASDGLVRPDAQGRATLAVGQVLEIALMANASTGYQWQIVSDGAPSVVRTSGPATPPPMDTQPPMPGAPSLARWWFRAETSGEVRLRLEYRRPWEKDVPAAQVAEYVVMVN